MRVLVAGAFESTSRYAHAINTVKMAQGFARAGNETALVCRRSRGGKITPTAFAERFGLTAPLHLTQVPRWANEKWLFALCALPTLRRHRTQLVYARNYILPALSAKLGYATVAESHAHPGNRSRPLMRLVRSTQLRSFRLLVTIADRLAENFQSLGVPPEKILVLPDAVDLELFSRPEALPPSPYAPGGCTVVYAGHLYDYKGIPTVLEAAGMLPDLDFHMVGGLPEDTERQRGRAESMGLRNVTFHGHIDQSLLPPYLWRADVLLLPPSGDHPSAHWTSPVKLGEYLASGVPVVASDIPALRAWLKEDEVVRFRPDDAADLARAISSVLESSDLAQSLAKRGLLRAQELSYTSRAKRILEHPMVKSTLAETQTMS
jgi:glycosyltransferase involved in cell wall biosynthesis